MNGRGRTGLLLGVALLAGALGASLLMEGESGNSPAQSGRSGEEPASSTDISYSEQQNRIRVEVLNGAGDPGAAAIVTEHLRDAGFDVKTYGNASGFDYPQSLVLDRSGRPGAADIVSAALNGAEIRVELDPELHLDATVILGSDWRTALTPPETETP